MSFDRSEITRSGTILALEFIEEEYRELDVPFILSAVGRWFDEGIQL